jgi:Ca2+-binding RTX toxin-like protein
VFRAPAAHRRGEERPIIAAEVMCSREHSSSNGCARSQECPLRKPSSKKFRPGMLSLEDRKLMTVDTTLTVGIVTDHRVNPATSSVLVDGSDYDDHIQVTSYQPGQSLSFQLEKWSNGVQLSSATTTVNIRGLNLQLNSPFQIVGRGGNDQIINLTSAKFSVDGGAGRDLIKTGPGGDIVHGGDDNDTIIGGTGNDVLYGDIGDDYIRGGDGADVIVDTQGRNLIYGEGGNDLLQPPNFSLTGNPDGDTIDGGTGNDTIYGGPGNDTINGGDGNDVIEGEGGNDIINGGAGDDVIHGDNTVFGRGSDGNDTIDGGVGNDTIYGGGGDDTIYGSDGNDRLFGEAGRDYLNGGNGNDYLDGGYWAYGSPFGGINVADYLYGGPGADTFVRHKVVLGSDDPDVFADYNSALGDTTNNVWHTF